MADLDKLVAALERNTQVAEMVPKTGATKLRWDDLASPQMKAVAADLGLTPDEINALCMVFAEHVAKGADPKTAMRDDRAVTLMVGLTFGYLGRLAEEQGVSVNPSPNGG
jgi:hypothetical protein